MEEKEFEKGDLSRLFKVADSFLCSFLCFVEQEKGAGYGLGFMGLQSNLRASDDGWRLMTGGVLTEDQPRASEPLEVEIVSDAEEDASKSRDILPVEDQIERFKYATRVLCDALHLPFEERDEPPVAQLLLMLQSWSIAGTMWSILSPDTDRHDERLMAAFEFCKKGYPESETDAEIKWEYIKKALDFPDGMPLPLDDRAYVEAEIRNYEYKARVFQRAYCLNDCSRPS